MSIQNSRTKFAFLLPALLYLMLLAIFPFFWTLILSFTRWNANIMQSPEWVGFGNYSFFLFEDSRFWGGLFFTLQYVIFSVGLELIIAVLLVLLLGFKIKGKNFFKILFLLPMACPPIAVAFLWRMILHPDSGIINTFLQYLGMEGVKWTTDVFIAPFTIIMVDVWEWTPFLFLALHAAYQSIPTELFEAAEVDGANLWQKLFYISLPCMLPVIITISLIRAIDAFKLFELVFGITSGGPGSATESLSYYGYLVGMKWFKLGRGSAISILFVIILIGLVFTLVYRFKKGWTNEEN